MGRSSSAARTGTATVVPVGAECGVSCSGAYFALISCLFWDPDAVHICVPALPRGMTAEAFLRVMEALSQGFAEAVERSSLWLPSESRFLALLLSVYLFPRSVVLGRPPSEPLGIQGGLLGIDRLE